MDFAVAGDSYDRFMGRYSAQLAPRFADFAGISSGTRVLDVGCGAGALTVELAGRIGPEHVSAIDPAESLVAACRTRVPSADVRSGAAEELPWPDASFDMAVSQLVLSLLRDARAGVAEMRRVVRRGGRVAACMWAAGAGMQMVNTFWQAARVVQLTAPDADARMPYRSPAELQGLAERAGLSDVTLASLPVQVTYPDFDDFWQPMLDAAGPIRAFCASLSGDQLAQVRAECCRCLGSPAGPFTLQATALAFRGRA
jgi:SAM-dependent methyltransferase